MDGSYNGISSNYVTCLLVNPNTHKMIVGGNFTTAGSISANNIAAFSDSENDFSNIISVNKSANYSYSLSQNYPNPFNPVTNINYTVAKDGLVKIKVYDVLGNEVCELLNQIKAAGSYTLQFNASNLPSGVYFYKLETDNFIDTKKMLLIK